MSNAHPLVSVVIPTFNRAEFLSDAISSVTAQSYDRWELLVVDDGSTDDTPAVLSEFDGSDRIRCFRQQNQGQAVARNHGIRMARGEYVAFLDSDNRWLSDKLEIQVEFLTAHPDIDVLYGDKEDIDAGGEVVARGDNVKRHSGLIWRPLLIDNFVNFNTTIVRKAALTKVGGFDETVRRADDYDLWLRLSSFARFHYRPGIVVQYRIEGPRISDSLMGRYESNLSAVGRFIDRNRDLLEPGEIGDVHAKIDERFSRGFSGQGDHRNALRLACRSIGRRPTRFPAWRTLAAVAYRAIRASVKGFVGR